MVVYPYAAAAGAAVCMQILPIGEQQTPQRCCAAPGRPLLGFKGLGTGIFAAAAASATAAATAAAAAAGISWGNGEEG